jgi:phage shock protein PspC (stress-responsive transcriptional regulator)
MLHRVAKFFDIDPHSLTIGWTIFVIVAVTFFIYIFSREDEQEKKRERFV